MKNILYLYFFLVSSLVQGEAAWQFPFDCYQALETPQNHCFSPYSLGKALEQIEKGARGITQQEIQNVLPIDQESTPLLPSASCTVYQACALWIRDDMTLDPLYAEKLQESTPCPIYTFSCYEKDKTITSINQWISTNTQGKISSLISPSSFTDDTRLLLTHTLYFAAPWQKPFDPSSTYEEPFFSYTAGPLPVLMMHQTSLLPYAENHDYQLLCLPFEKSPYIGFFLLPKKESPFPREEFCSLLDTLSLERVAVSLPRFCIETESSVKTALQRLGIRKAFSSQAEFSFCLDPLALSLQDILHKVYFSCTETGVEAAASTAVIIGVTSIPQPPSYFFEANHPFFFGILDLNSQNMLFLGKYLSP